MKSRWIDWMAIVVSVIAVVRESSAGIRVTMTNRELEQPVAVRGGGFCGGPDRGGVGERVKHG